MIKTYGLTHISLSVRDPERPFRFYHDVFGLVETYRDDGEVQGQTPGCHDVVVFSRRARGAGKSGGIAHFGFRLVSPKDIDRAVAAVLKAGGVLLRRGEFSAGFPYAYVSDPDGYEVEIWFE